MEIPIIATVDVQYDSPGSNRFFVLSNMSDRVVRYPREALENGGVVELVDKTGQLVYVNLARVAALVVNREGM